MNINTVKIDTVLEYMALDGLNRFNAYYVAHLSEQTDVDMVNEYLLMKSRFGILKIKVETICPNGHVDQQFELNDIPQYGIQCRFCEVDELYVPDLNNTNIVYYFSDNYIGEIKKKQKNRFQKLAI